MIEKKSFICTCACHTHYGATPGCHTCYRFHHYPTVEEAMDALHKFDMALQSIQERLKACESFIDKLKELVK